MIKKILKFFLKAILWFLAIPIIAVVIFKWVPVPATPLMVIRSYEQWKEDKPIVWKHDWVSIDEISDYLELAVVCTEDQNFIKHNGFDMGAIEKQSSPTKREKKQEVQAP